MSESTPPTGVAAGQPGGSASTTSSSAVNPKAAAGPSIGGRWQRLANSRSGQRMAFAWAWRKPILFGVGAGYFAATYYGAKWKAAKRDHIRPDTVLHWRMYDGGIVEYPSSQSTLGMLMDGDGENAEPPRIMTLFEAVRTLKWIQGDDRIKGVFADFSTTNAPVIREGGALNLAQIEELQDAIVEMKEYKKERFGPGGFRTVAFAESFKSQSDYLLASCFARFTHNLVVPLVGMSSSIPFYGRLARWLGIKVHVEARNEYKSFVAPYTEEHLSEPQRLNQEELLNDLNDNMMNMIAVNRFPSEYPDDSASTYARVLTKVKDLSLRGPYNASEAVKVGLLTGTAYKSDLLESLMSPPTSSGQALTEVDAEGAVPAKDVVADEVDKREQLKTAMKDRLKGFYHYNRITTKRLAKAKHPTMDVGVVYVLGAIGDVGEFGTSAIVKGLKEAGDDETVGAVVLRIDTGGGGVLESDTIWGAVRDLRNKGKIVVASFGGAAASGGYFIATHADAIFASPSTITGSIGVASLRPTVTQSFLDKLHLNVQSFFTGSKSQSLFNELEGEDLARHTAQVDETYEDFKNRVCTGRGISPEVVDSVAGGRVYTGLKAWELLYPPEEAKEMTEAIEAAVREATIGAAESLGQELPAKSTDVVSVVSLDEDQDTSPYAPPAPAVTDLLASTTELPISPSEPLVTSQEVTPPTPTTPNTHSEVATVSMTGPLGRGIVDGIGGIRDAAIYAVEVYLAAALQQEQVKYPEKAKSEILRELMPGVEFAYEDDEKLVLPMDVQLKKFPVRKSFWQQIRETSLRGDSMDSGYVSAFSLVKVAFASWMTKAASHMLSSEVDALGLTDLRRGLIQAQREMKVGGIRAEMPALQLR